MGPISDQSITEAIEVTKAAIHGENAAWIGGNGAEITAKFIETIARKLEELRTGQASR